MASGVQSFLSVTAGTGLLILGIVGTQAKAATVTFMGNTTGQPTWARPVENGSSPPNSITTIFGNAVPYSSQAFYVSTTGSYNFLSLTPQNPSNWDNYTFLYQYSFAPSNQLANIIIGNNTYQGTTPIPSGVNASGFDNVSLTANTQYYFVTTGASNTDYGTFTNTISGTGSITLGLSPTAVPFAFSPGLGLSILGAWFGISQLRTKMGKRKNSQGVPEEETSEPEVLKTRKITHKSDRP